LQFYVEHEEETNICQIKVVTAALYL